MLYMTCLPPLIVQMSCCVISTGGPLEDALKNKVLTPQQVLRVFYATCSAVAAMHSQSPPIIHRDIKVGQKLHQASCGVVL